MERNPRSKNGWFIPSRTEWTAFGEGLKLTKDNYSKEPVIGLHHYIIAILPILLISEMDL